MSIKDEYSVRPIDSDQYKEWILKKHYAKRMPSVSFAYGLFDVSNTLSGICTIGNPLASQLQQACGGKYKVVELNRLVVNDNLPKNTLSYFVSCSLKQLPAPIIVVSYADTAMAHHGYIYQATNWIYTGEGAGGTQWAVRGLEHMHHTSIEDSVGRYENRDTSVPIETLLRNKYGDRLYKRNDSPKYRYFYLVGNRKHKQDMMSNFTYEILPYPKGDNQRYDASYEPTIQEVLF